MAARNGFAIDWTMTAPAAGRRAIEAVAAVIPHELAAAGESVMGEELAEMQNRTPELRGNLKGSGRLLPAEITRDNVVFRVRFGEGIEPYAVKQHQVTRFDHPQGGGPGYVVLVLQESQRHILGRVARRLTLGRSAGG